MIVDCFYSKDYRELKFIFRDSTVKEQEDFIHNLGIRLYYASDINLQRVAEILLQEKI